jgi:hypothetical protein
VTVARAAKPSPWLRRQDAGVLVHRPRVVVVELGVNAHDRPADETPATLRRSVRRLRKAGTAVVVVYTPFRTCDRTIYREGRRDRPRRERASG